MEKLTNLEEMIMKCVFEITEKEIPFYKLEKS